MDTVKTANQKTKEQLEQDLKAIDEMRNSRGWAIINDAMKDDIFKAACYISDNGNLPIEEIHFRRGALWAARILLDVPDKIYQMTLNDAMMLMASEETKSKSPKEK